MKNKRLLENLAELARSKYVKCMDLAISDDFANPKLKLLHKRIIQRYAKLKNKSLKQLKLFIYTAGTIYNKEMLYNNDLCFHLNLLCYIVKNKAYTVDKFDRLWNTLYYKDLLRFGWTPKIDTIKLKNMLLEGINVTNS